MFPPRLRKPPRMKISFLFFSLLISLAAVAPTSAEPNYWKTNPVDGNWQTGANWSLGFGGGDAVFGVSTITDIYNEGGFTSIMFEPGASAYTFKPFSNPIITGTGITNNSSFIQNFETNSFQAYFIYGSFTIGSRIVFTLNSFTGANFFDTTSAGEGTFLVRSNAGVVFFGNATGGNAGVTLEDGGYARFTEDSSAGNATLTALGDAYAGFVELNDNSLGGTARIRLSGKGFLRVYYHNPPGVTVGSTEGDGSIQLGDGVNARNLTVGTNDLDTTLSGLITDGGAGGTLSKLGQGSFALTGANTYTGGTLIRKGRLLANSATGSATGTGPVRVAAGTLGGKGIISGSVTIGTGNLSAALLAPGVNGTGVLTIQNTLDFGVNGSYRWDLDSDAGQSDQIVAAGVTVAAGARFRGAAHGTAAIPVGTVFTVINNTAATSIAGTFSNLADGATISIGSNTLQADYEGGDGNNLTLTVVPQP